MPLPAPTPGGAPPVQQPGTYLTEQSKLEAALPKFIEAADRYPSTQAGIVARYHAAAILARLGRFGEAEQRFQEVVAKAGTSLYARTGRLGLAEAQVAQKKYDNAITIYTEMSRDTSSQLPVDGVLMQLGRACARAGRKEEAVRAFTRVTEEFPTSLYIGRRQTGARGSAQIVERVANRPYTASDAPDDGHYDRPQITILGGTGRG